MAKTAKKIDLSQVPKSVTYVLENVALEKLKNLQKNTDLSPADMLEEGKIICMQALNSAESCSDTYYNKYRLTLLTRRSMDALMELVNNTIENGKNYEKILEEEKETAE